MYTCIMEKKEDMATVPGLRQKMEVDDFEEDFTQLLIEKEETKTLREENRKLKDQIKLLQKQTSKYKQKPLDSSIS